MTEFEDLKTITGNIASQLKKANINTVESLAMETFEELREKLKGVSEEKIREIQIEVWKSKGYWFTPANKLTELRKAELTFSTGSKKLDDLLWGGIRTRSITEFAGEYGTGKTEILLTSLIETLGKNRDITAIFFDTEETFKENRVNQIAQTRGYTGETILENTIYTPIWHTQHFIEVVNQADLLIKSRNVKLVLIDSIIGPLRAEYVGRETLSYRQQLLNKILRNLLNYAKAFNLAVVVTNQVVANPNSLFMMDPVSQQIPTGGNILAHNAETRIHLRKAQGNVRIARLIDSSWLPPGECLFRITEKGIEDVEEKRDVSES